MNIPFLVLLTVLFFGISAHSSESSSVKAVIFDCDGTLVDNEYIHFSSWQKALKMRGCDLTEAEFFPFFPGRSGPEIAGLLNDRFHLDSSLTLLEDQRRIYLRSLENQEALPIERTVRLVKELAERKEELGIRLALASGSSKKHILINLKNLGFEEIFDVVVSGTNDLNHYSDSEGVNKPKPYIYLEAAKQLGVDPSHCIAFEDTNTGVRAAVSAGMKTFAVPNSYTKAQDFSLAYQTLSCEEEITADQLFNVLSQEKFFSN